MQEKGRCGGASDSCGKALRRLKVEATTMQPPLLQGYLGEDATTYFIKM